MNNIPDSSTPNTSRPSRNSAEQAFAAQDDEEFVEITSNGVAVPMNPNQTPRGASVRDTKGEYGLFNGQEHKTTRHSMTMRRDVSLAKIRSSNQLKIAELHRQFNILEMMISHVQFSQSILVGHQLESARRWENIAETRMLANDLEGAKVALGFSFTLIQNVSNETSNLSSRMFGTIGQGRGKVNYLPYS